MPRSAINIQNRVHPPHLWYVEPFLSNARGQQHIELPIAVRLQHLLLLLLLHATRQLPELS
jgi:hypothetical protein